MITTNYGFGGVFVFSESLLNKTAKINSKIAAATNITKSVPKVLLMIRSTSMISQIAKMEILVKNNTNINKITEAIFLRLVNMFLVFNFSKIKNII